MPKHKYAYEVAIIGAGPAGMGAATQLTRYGIDFIWFTEPANNALNNPWYNSLLANAHCVENYLGMPKTSGIDLLLSYKKQVEEYKKQPIFSTIRHLDYNTNDQAFLLHTAEKMYVAQRVIVASGTKANPHPIIENLSPDLKSKTSYTIVPYLKKCHNIFAIIGAGDAAFDYALNMAQHNNVHILARSAPKALPILVKSVRTNNKICYHAKSQVQEIKSTHDKTSMLQLECVVLDEHARKKNKILLTVDYLIAATGRIPQKDFYSQTLLANETKLIKNNLLFLAGDVQNKIYRQAILAVADGVKIAMVIAQNVNYTKDGEK